MTTTTASTRFSPPVSNNKGTSTTATGAPELFRILKKFLPRGAQHRMNDFLKPLHGGGIVHHTGGEPVAVDFAIRGRAGKCRLDGSDRLAFVEPMNSRIRVVNRNAGFRE